MEKHDVAYVEKFGAKFGAPSPIFFKWAWKYTIHTNTDLRLVSFKKENQQIIAKVDLKFEVLKRYRSLNLQ